MTDERVSTMRQTAPYPAELADLVERCQYRPGWTVTLGDVSRDLVDPSKWRGANNTRDDELAGGLTLTITTRGYDSYHVDRGETYRVHHYFIVPAATYNRQSWQRWLFERFCDVEKHEAMEFFAIGGERPFSPNHGPGFSPYDVTELTTDEARRTRFTGEVR